MWKMEFESNLNRRISEAIRAVIKAHPLDGDEIDDRDYYGTIGSYGKGTALLRHVLRSELFAEK